jgi:hypothetical protein
MSIKRLSGQADSVRNEIIALLAAKPSWLSVMDGGTVRPEEGETLPTGAPGDGSMTYTLQGTRGRSEVFAPMESTVSQERKVAAFKRSVADLMIADARNNAVVSSGFKYVAAENLIGDFAGRAPEVGCRLTGGEYEIAASFAGPPPDSAITAAELRKIRVKILRQSNQLGKACCVCSEESMDRLRKEDASLHDVFEFITDETPLHFNKVDKNGSPDYIVPWVEEGTMTVPNPDWLSAKNEVMALVWGDSFRRRVPIAFIEGNPPVQPQFAIGPIAWSSENNCFLFQIIRAWQPMKPWACCPILTRRLKS